MKVDIVPVIFPPTVIFVAVVLSESVLSSAVVASPVTWKDMLSAWPAPLLKLLRSAPDKFEAVPDIVASISPVKPVKLAKVFTRE